MRTSLSIRDLLLLTISTLTLLITLLAAEEVVVNWQQLLKIQALKAAVVMSDQLFTVTEALSDERDVAYTLLHAADRATAESLRAQLQSSGEAADAAFRASMLALAQYHFPEIVQFRSTVERQLSVIQGLRAQIGRTATGPQRGGKALSDRWFAESTALLVQTQDLWVEFSRHFVGIDPVVTQHLRYKHFLRIISDYTGRQRAIIGRLIAENADPTPQELAELLRGAGVIDLSWKLLHILADQSGLYADIAPYYTDARSHYQTLYGMVHDIFYVPGLHHGMYYPLSANLWLELSGEAKDSFNTFKNASLAAIHRHVEKLEIHARHVIALHSVVLLLALALCWYSFRVINVRVMRPIHLMIAALVDAIQGRPVAMLPAVTGGQGEIDQLAQVLHAFQQNVEKIRETSRMLENYTHSLERSNKELDDFAYIASHDLKEPLRGLFNHATFLLEDYKEKLDEDGVRKLHRLAYLSQRMERLVNDLLYFSRLGRQEMAIQPADMNEVIADIEKTLELFLEERHARITIPKKLPTVTCDKVRVTEVFRNLITNAVKYNDKEDKIVEIGFLEQYAFPGGRPAKNVFYVRDNGKGIPAEFYEEIFRIFKRLQGARDAPEEGTGAGLTFVKKIIERHGGHVWPESQVGSGTSFYFTLAA